MKFALLFLLLFSINSFGQTKPYYSSDGFQIEATGKVLKDDHWNVDPQTQAYVRNYSSNSTRVEIIKSGDKLQDITAVEMTDGHSFVQAHHFDFNSDGSVKTLTYCVGNTSDCLSVNMEDCNRLVKEAGFDTGSKLQEQMRNCESIKKAKEKFRDYLLGRGMQQGQKIEGRIYNVGKIGVPKQGVMQFFSRRIDPSQNDPFSETIMGMCSNAFWDRTLPTISTKSETKPSGKATIQ
jgi:hypothetical protein